MGRGKLPLRLIPNLKSRKTTFEKRSRGLLKKASELSILCDVGVCLFIHDFKNVDPPVTWPEDSDQVRRHIAAYEVAVAKNPNSKRLSTMSDFFSERAQKVTREAEKLSQETNNLILRNPGNYKHKLVLWESCIAGLSGSQKNELQSLLNSKIEQVEKRLRYVYDNFNQFAKKERQMNMQQPSLQYYNSSHEAEAITTQMHQLLPCYPPQQWSHDHHQPCSSNIPFPIASKTQPFDLNNGPYNGSFTMLLTSDDYHVGDHQHGIEYYGSSSTMLYSSPKLEYGMRHNDQMFSNNAMALQSMYMNQPQLPLLTYESQYQLAMEPVYGQSSVEAMMVGSSSQGGQVHASDRLDMKYYYHNANDFQLQNGKANPGV